MTSNHDRRADYKGQNRNRRRKYIINPTFQWKYAVTIGLAVFLISTIIGSVLYGVLHHQARLRMMHPDTYLADVTSVLFLFGVSFALVTAAGVAVWSIIMTHRICGPLFVMEQYLAQLAEGNIPQPRALRNKDEFKSFYASFLKAMKALRKRRRQELEALTEALGIVRSASDTTDLSREALLESAACRIYLLRKATMESIGDRIEHTCAGPRAGSEAKLDSPVTVV